MLHIRKSLMMRETLTSDMDRPANRPIVRAVAMAEFAGRYADDLTELFKAGRMRIRSGPVAVGRAGFLGKGAIVGLNGEHEHGGASLDLPLSHKDESWSFDHFDTITVSIPDAPKPDEIVVVIAVADGGRLHPRCGSGPQ